MNKTSIVLSIALALSTLAGCSGNLMTFNYHVDPVPSGPRYLTTHCVSSNNCTTLTTTPEPSKAK